MLDCPGAGQKDYHDYARVPFLKGVAQSLSAGDVDILFFHREISQTHSPLLPGALVPRGRGPGANVMGVHLVFLIYFKYN